VAITVMHPTVRTIAYLRMIPLLSADEMQGKLAVVAIQQANVIIAY
jgi:hypothetical protein